MFIESITAKTRVRQKFLPFTVPSISGEEINEVTQTLLSGCLVNGPKTKIFETKFAEYIGCRHAIAVNSGPAGRHLALIASGIKPGDEILLPAFTFASTVNVVVQCCANPLFVDVNDDLNLKVSEIPHFVNSKTKAILPADFAGHPAALTEIFAIAQKHNLVVIEDAAHAIGSSYRGLKIGSISPITIFSFEQSNIMTTGDGGMVCTNDDKIAEKIRNLSLSASNQDVEKLDHKLEPHLGGSIYSSYRMSEIQSAIGLCQLAKLKHFISIRQHYADIYNDTFRFIPEISLPPVSHDSLHSWHIYVIFLNLERLAINRAQFIEALRFENIGAGVPFCHLNLHNFYLRGWCPNSIRSSLTIPTPNANWLSERIVALPLYPKMTEKDVFDTIRAIKKITKRMAK